MDNGVNFKAYFFLFLANKQPIQSAEKKVWSLKLDTEDDDVDLIDEDELLDEEDLKRPDQASLRGDIHFGFFSFSKQRSMKISAV